MMQADAKPFWCIVVIPELPEKFSDEGVILTMGFPENYEYKDEDLEFVVLFRTISCTEKDAHDVIRKTLSMLGVQAVWEIHTISTQADQMIRSERQTVQRLQVGEVRAVDSFFGLKRRYKPALEEALSIVQRTVIRRKWQFWR
jgi:hypothetical protein